MVGPTEGKSNQISRLTKENKFRKGNQMNSYQMGNANAILFE